MKRMAIRDKDEVGVSDNQPSAPSVDQIVERETDATMPLDKIFAQLNDEGSSFPYVRNFREEGFLSDIYRTRSIYE